MKMFFGMILVLLVWVSPVANAQLKVLACEAEWAALAVAIGGENVQVHSATTSHQHPHYIQARPSLIAKHGRQIS